MTLTYHWRGDLTNAEINALHADGFDHPVRDDDWLTQLHRHSLGWVCARDDASPSALIGFVNVAWDGGVHAFLLDTLVHHTARRRGIATQLVATTVPHARAAGCEWLHVDFDDHLRPFYFDACGFRSTPAGVIQLR